MNLLSLDKNFTECAAVNDHNGADEAAKTDDELIFCMNTNRSPIWIDDNWWQTTQKDLLDLNLFGNKVETNDENCQFVISAAPQLHRLLLEIIFN